MNGFSYDVSNPYVVARKMRCDESPCPECGGVCSMVAEVSGGAPKISFVCGKCGTIEAGMHFDGDGDLCLEARGRPCFRTFPERDGAESGDWEKLAEAGRCA